MLKRIISMLLIAVTLFCVCSTPVYAAKTLRFDSLDTIAEDLEVFKTISSGTISVVSHKNQWYYQFYRKGADKVQIKVTAFSTQPKNNYLSADNAALTKNCNSNYSRICYYNRMETRDIFFGYKLYTTSMYRFNMETQGLTHDEITLKCKLTHGITFEYHSKIPASGLRFENGKIVAQGTYVTPEGAGEYLKALKRTSSLAPIVPTAMLSVKNTGTNNVCLSTYTLCGVGDSSTKLNVNSLISVGAAAKSVLTAASASNPVSGMVALTKLIGGTKTLLTKKSNQYNTGESTALSKHGQKPILKAEYTSPITLADIGDWFQVTTKLNNSKFHKKTDATFNIAFSFSPSVKTK